MDKDGLEKEKNFILMVNYHLKEYIKMEKEMEKGKNITIIVN